MKPEELPGHGHAAVLEPCPHCNGPLGRVSHFKHDEAEFYCTGCGLVMRRKLPEVGTKGPGGGSSELPPA